MKRETVGAGGRRREKKEDGGNVFGGVPTVTTHLRLRGLLLRERARHLADSHSLFTVHHGGARRHVEDLGVAVPLADDDLVHCTQAWCEVVRGGERC